AGAPWIAHEWLAGVVLAAVYAVAGWQGLVALAAFCAAAVPALLARYMLRFVHPIYALGTAPLAVLLLGPGILAPPHILPAPRIVLWVCELVSARHEGRTPRMLVLPLMMVWANLHGGFTVGLAIAGALALEAIAEADAGARLRTAAVWLRF